MTNGVSCLTRVRITTSLLALAATMIAGSGYAQSSSDAQPVADTVYRNGFVYTVDGALSRAQAFAVKDGKFIAVGTDDDMKAHTGDDTEVINLRGRMAMPGLVDTHIHALRGALTALGVIFPTRVDGRSGSTSLMTRCISGRPALRSLRELKAGLPADHWSSSLRVRRYVACSFP